jgi:hypothetical protein
VDRVMERVRYCFLVPEGTALIGIEVETLSLDGRVRWTLGDPSGEVRWSRPTKGAIVSHRWTSWRLAEIEAVERGQGHPRQSPRELGWAGWQANGLVHRRATARRQ